jgi:hypothetical protein
MAPLLQYLLGIFGFVGCSVANSLADLSGQFGGKIWPLRKNFAVVIFTLLKAFVI